MDWKDGLTAAAVVGLGYLGIKSLTKSEESPPIPCECSSCLTQTECPKCESENILIRHYAGHPFATFTQLVCWDCHSQDDIVRSDNDPRPASFLDAETFEATAEAKTRYVIANNWDGGWPVRIHVEGCPIERKTDSHLKFDGTFTANEVAQASYEALLHNESLPQFQGNTFGDLMDTYAKDLIMPCNCTIHQANVLEVLYPATFTRETNEQQEHWDAESFSADEYGVPFHLWAKGDMRIVADYDHDFWDRDIEGWGWESDEEYEQFVNHVNEYGVYILRLEKWNPEVGVGWESVDSVTAVPNPLNTLIDIAREQFSEFGDFKEAESHEYVYHGSCEDRLKKLVKMLKGAGVWYSNPTIENYMEYEGVSEKEAKELVSLNWNDELDTTIAYLLDYAKDGGFPRTEI